MKVILAASLLILSTVAASAQFNSRSPSYGGLYGTGSNSSSHYVKPHYNSSSGTFTSGHYRTNPNNTQRDNYSTRGNYNPYTGSYGTRIPRY